MLFCAIKLGSAILTLLAMIVQLAALAFYCASFIPFAQVWRRISPNTRFMHWHGTVQLSVTPACHWPHSTSRRILSEEPVVQQMLARAVGVETSF